jgi:hypothetical protein
VVERAIDRLAGETQGDPGPGAHRCAPGAVGPDPGPGGRLRSGAMGRPGPAEMILADISALVAIARSCTNATISARPMRPAR